MEQRIKNKNHNIEPIYINKNNPIFLINLGITSPKQSLSTELEKAKTAKLYGAKILGDVSTLYSGEKFRNEILKLGLPISTVPIYAVFDLSLRERNNILSFSFSDIENIILKQARSGIDIMTLHCSLTQKLLKFTKNSERIIKTTSRGGAWLIKYMLRKKCENPLFEYFDVILDILKEYDVALSIGNVFRPACIYDDFEEVSKLELGMQGELVKKCLDKNITVMIEGLCHIRYGSLDRYIKEARTKTFNVPLRIMGPILTDIGVGNEHISGSIGAFECFKYNIEIFTCITAAEHLGIPSIKNIEDSLIAYRIAKHSFYSKNEENLLIEKNIAEARKVGNWKKLIRYYISKKNILKKKNRKFSNQNISCSMCGKYCALKVNKECF